jgi:CheY-like chemotaxis protein
LGDAVRIRQILLNLIGNARKFTATGHVKTIVEAEILQDGRIRFLMKVEDTGIGIPTDKLDYIFDKFSQADASTTRKFGGTGLGLAICRKLVEMMGGKIFATSTMGQGSTFHFSLLLDECRDEETINALQNAEKELPGQTKGTLRFKGTKLLVAEDNPVNLDVAVAILEGYGCTIITAGDGKMAVEKAIAESFDLIFMDLQMPEMDGLEAAQNLRARGITTPIIAFTANALKGDNKKCLEAGMNDYLSKPIDAQKLEKILLKWIAKKKQEEPAQITQKPLERAIDAEAFARMKDLMGNRFETVLEKFLKTAKDYVGVAEKAIGMDDKKSIARAMHPLKSSAASFGFVALANLAASMEAQAEEGKTSTDFQKQIQELQTHLNQAEDFIRKNSV